MPKKGVKKIHPVKSPKNRKNIRKSVRPVGSFVFDFHPETEAIHKIKLREENSNAFLADSIRKSTLPASLKPPAKKAVLYFVFSGLVLAGIFSAILYVFAVPPDSKYDFGATLDPNCSPGDTNCSVAAPAQYSFSSNNFSGTGGFTTTGTITGATLNITGLTASKPVFTDSSKNLTSTGTLTADQGGTGLASLTAYAVLAGGTTSTGNLQQISGLGTSGQVLTSTGAGALPTWQDATAGTVTGTGANTRVAYWSGTSSLTSNSSFTFDGTILSTPTFATDSSSTGITMTGATGVLTIAGAGNTNNENLTVDFETAANTVAVSTSTGVTKVDFADTITLEAGVANIITESSGYQVDGLRVITNKGSTGSENLFLGQSGNFTLTGTKNITAGYQAGNALTSGYGNQLIGYQAGYSTTTGSNDVFLGEQAGYTNISGNANVFLGYQAGYYETGSNKLFIDNQQRASEADARTKALVYGVFDAAVANQILTVNGKLVAIGGVAIGADAANNLIDDASGGTGSTTLYIGNSSINVTAPSDISVKEDIINTSYGINNLMNLSVKDFKYKKDYVDEGEQQKAHTGMLAQEVEQIYPEAVIYRSDGLKSIDYTKIIPLIIKSIQDLKNNNFTGSGSWGAGNLYGVQNNSFAADVKNGLISLGAYIEKGVATFEKLIAQKATIKTARIEKLEMMDSATGAIYCTWIQNGEWQKAEGDCSSVKATTVVTETKQPEPEPAAPEGASLAPEEREEREEPEPEHETGSNDVFAQQIEELAEQTAKQAAKDAAKELKEEIKKEVKEEMGEDIKAEIASPATAVGARNDEEVGPLPAQDESPAAEPEPEPALDLIPPIQEIFEPAQDILEPVIDVIEEAVAGLLNGVIKFFARLTETAIWQTSSIMDWAKKMSSLYFKLIIY